MNKGFNKLAILVAVLLFAIKGRANINNKSSDPKIKFVISKIQLDDQNDRELLSPYFVLNMPKAMLEDELDVDLTDNEFSEIQSLVDRLVKEGVALELVPFDKMILATQELSSGHGG